MQRTDPRSSRIDVAQESKEATKVVVSVDHLRKIYGTTIAADDVSFSVKQGEILGVLGPNGAGKTTAVECISGLRVPDSGTIQVLGLNPQTERSEIRRIMGVQLQESSLPPKAKVREAIGLFASFYSKPVDKDELLDALGLRDKVNSYFKDLSGGQKQRVSIALALIGNPKIVILDELSTGLDPEARREIWKYIEHIRSHGTTMVLVTHFMDEAERLCDSVVIINHGKVVAAGTPAELASHEGSHMRFVPSKPIPDTLISKIPGVMKVEHEGPHTVVTGMGDLYNSVLGALAKVGVEATDVQVRPGSLEDAFIHIVKSGSQDIEEVG